MHLHAHGHGPGDGHGESPVHGLAVTRHANARRMLVALAANVAMVAIGLLGAVLTGSLALLADAGHVLSDVLSIALGMAAAKFALRPASGRGTFGMGRVEIFAALVNGLALVVVAVYIAIAAVGRFSDGHDVDGAGVLLFGGLGLVGNVIATAVLAGGDRGDINFEGVLRHSFADALGSLGVIVAGAGILLTGWQPLDPIVGLALALVILLSSWRLIHEPLEVLLERAPAGLETAEVGTAIAGVPGVREVHDLHVWSITSGFPALAAHVTVKATHEPDTVRSAIELMLAERFELAHTTLQVSREQLLQIESAGDDV
ncbi:MAG: cation transporter [Thermoleophilia bacterium]|nr:cation transporter [Thermoleophilia bacterium]